MPPDNRDWFTLRPWLARTPGASAGHLHERGISMSKKKIAVFVVAGLGSLLVGVAILAYYDFTHNFHVALTSQEVSNAQIALKGAIGEAIFSGQQSEAASDLQVKGKNGLDALLSPPSAGNRGLGLIEAYQKDPQRFKRYAEMLDTATNAKQVGDFLLRQDALHPPRTSDSLPMDTKLKVDAWGNPFCIIPVGKRVAVVSGGPSHLSCDALPLSAQQIAASSRSLYAGPGDLVVLVVARRRDGRLATPSKIGDGSGTD
jgi:hypothetical protein